MNNLATTTCKLTQNQEKESGMKVKKVFLSIMLFAICFVAAFGSNAISGFAKARQKINRTKSPNTVISSQEGYYKALKRHLYKMDKNFTINTTVRLDNELRKNNWKKWYKIFDKLDADHRIKNMCYDLKYDHIQPYYNHVRHAFSFKYSVSSKDLNRYYKFIKKWTRKYIDSEMTDEEKVRGIHDYIVSKCNYSYGDKGKEWFKKSRKNASNAKLGKFSVYTPLAMVFKNGGVCDAYSRLFYDMAKKAGLKVKYIVGKIDNSGLHAWNLVKVEGKWHHIDVTWDDNNAGAEDYDYEYYLKSDEYMREKQHSWNKKSYPKCRESYEIEDEDEDYDVDDETTEDEDDIFISPPGNVINGYDNVEKPIPGSTDPVNSNVIDNIGTGINSFDDYSEYKGSIESYDDLDGLTESPDEYPAIKGTVDIDDVVKGTVDID